MVHKKQRDEAIYAANDGTDVLVATNLNDEARSCFKNNKQLDHASHWVPTRFKTKVVRGGLSGDMLQAMIEHLVWVEGSVPMRNMGET